MRYRCISPDPPWNERGGGKSTRGAQRHYGLMKTPDIADLLAEELGVIRERPLTGGEPRAVALRSDTKIEPSGCHLWIWVTDNYLRDGLWVMEQLGFRYIRTLAWEKQNDHGGLYIGLGQYLRGSHELCLLGTLALGGAKAMVPDPGNRPPSVVRAPRGEHSAKPQEAYSVMERVSPGPRLEMFARNARPGWDCWGNQAPEQAIQEIEDV